MFNFKNILPFHYQDCFENSNKLKQYLNDPEFIHALESLLYYSQKYYFHDNPDYLGEFLLMYRDTLINALYNFEFRGIKLENYIGFLLKLYRKNFYKIKTRIKEKDSKFLTSYDDKNIDFFVNNENLESIYESKNIFITGKPSSIYLYNDFIYGELEEIKSKKLIESIEKIQKEVIKLNNSKLFLESTIIIKILLICNQEYLNPMNISQLLQKSRWSYDNFTQVMNKRDEILQTLRLKKNESYRKLHHSYLNYQQSQALLDKAKQDASKVPSEVVTMQNKLAKHYSTFLRLQERYLSLRLVLTLREVAELCDISVEELKKYYRYLRKCMNNIIKDPV